MSQKIISIVISAYNEEGNIAELYKELIVNTKQNKNIGLKYRFEYIFVNDGSRDNTLKKIKQLQKQDGDIRIVNLILLLLKEQSQNIKLSIIALYGSCSHLYYINFTTKFDILYTVLTQSQKNLSTKAGTSVHKC